MNFGKITLENLSDPKPSYEWTRNRLVKSINDYIASTLLDNQSLPQFGVTGMIEFPPASPVPYLYPPNSGPSCGGIVAYLPGMATESDYDAVAAKCRNGDGSFWENYFELIGRALLRSKLTIAPYLTILKNYPSNAGFSTPMIYTSEVLNATPSFYMITGNKFTEQKFLRDWRDAGSRVMTIMKSGKFDNCKAVWELVGQYVKQTATRSSFIWYQYNGEIRRDTDLYPGTFTGYIYGNLQFD